MMNKQNDTSHLFFDILLTKLQKFNRKKKIDLTCHLCEPVFITFHENKRIKCITSSECPTEFSLFQIWYEINNI